jgi:hypothetical protein
VRKSRRLPADYSRPPLPFISHSLLEIFCVSFVFFCGKKTFLSFSPSRLRVKHSPLSHNPFSGNTTHGQQNIEIKTPNFPHK